MSVASSEQWRPIPGWEGLYEVSDQGRVRSVDRVVVRRDGTRQTFRGQVIRPWVNPKGYLRTRLSRDGSPHGRAVHRLVLAAFVGPCPDGMEGCHNNGDKLDCTVGNLRWDTPSENALDRVRHGTHHEISKERCPRGHVLADPNLVASAKKYGGRHCKACNRAHANARTARLKGESYDFVASADSHYARIMGSDGPGSFAAAASAS